MACAVCSQVESYDSDETGENNAILTCCKCGVIVHEMCYGEQKTENWHCSFCRRDSGMSQPSIRKCQLCPIKEGALKETTHGRWVHVVCALFHPSCTFTNEVQMEPVCITDVSKASPAKRCNICRQITGACVKCYTDQCSKFMHVTCGQLKNLLREENNSGFLEFKLYCDEHIKTKPASRLSMVSIKNNVKSRYSVGQSSDVEEDNGATADMPMPAPPIIDDPPATSKTIFVPSTELHIGNDSVGSSSPDENTLYIFDPANDEIVGHTSRDENPVVFSQALPNVEIEYLFEDDWQAAVIDENEEGKHFIYGIY